MSKKKSLRTRGKISFSRYFQELKEGDKVSVVTEKAMQPRFPKELQGRTGVIEGKKGRVFIAKIKDHDKEKRYLIESIHLKKIN